MQEPIRVLMLFTILNRGGAETMVMNYYRRIDRRRVQFDFVVHRPERGAYEDEIEQLGGRIYRMMPVRPWTFWRYQRQVRLFFDEHPEYMIIHGHCSELGYFFYKEAAKRGVPVIIAHAHNSRADYDAKWLWRTWMKHQMRPYLTHRFTCGEEAALWLFGREGSKTAILQRNAIDTGAFLYQATARECIRQELAIGHDTLVVGHIGRFERQKNHPFVVKLFHHLHTLHPDSRLLLVGSGGDKEQEVRQLVARLQLEQQVLFLGSRDDVPQLLSAMDVFLLPSRMEGLPLSLLEAQCSGLPCVISDGVPQEACMTPLVSRLSLGLNTEQWAEALLKQATVRNDRVAYAQEIALKGYDISQNAQWLEEYYLKISE